MIFDTSYKEDGVYEISTKVKKERSPGSFVNTELTIDFEVLGISRFRMWFLRRILKRKGMSFEEMHKRKDFESRMRTTAHQAKDFMTTHKGAVRDDKLKELMN